MTKKKPSAKEGVQKAKSPAAIAFAARLEQIAEENINVPALNRGRNTWIATRMSERSGSTIAVESVRRWFAGENMPRPAALKILAELLGVSPGYLAMGDRTAPSKSVVNVEAIVGLVINMFHLSNAEARPAGNDGGVHIVAKIRGAQYRIHVTQAEKDGDSLMFSTPINVSDMFVMGVVRSKPLVFDFYEIPHEVLQSADRTGSAIIVRGTKGLKKIESFADRL